MNERIIPFTYNVKSDKKRAYPLFFTVVFISSILVVVSMTVEKYSGVISLLAVVGLTAAVLIYQRYITADYAYVVTAGEEYAASLVINKRVGNRVSTMAYLPLYGITSIQKFTKEELKTHKTPKTTKKYNYAPTYDPDSVYIVFAKTNEASFEIVLECVGDVASRLLEYSAYAKEDEIAKRNDEGDGYNEE